MNFILLFIVPLLSLAKIVKITNTETLSKETELYIRLNPIRRLGMGNIQALKFPKINGDKDIELNLIFPSNNGDLSVGPEHLYAVYKDTQKLDPDRFLLEYSFESNVYLDEELHKEVQDRDVYCKYQAFQSQLSIINQIDTTRQYTQILQCFRQSIGLSNKELYDVNNNNKLDLIQNGLNVNNGITYFRIIKQEPDNYYLIVFKSEMPRKIIIFQIIKPNDIVLSFSFIKDITTTSLGIDSTISINDANMYKQTYIIATTKGIFFDLEGTVTSVNNDINFISLSIVKSALYSIGKDSGLYIYDGDNFRKQPITKSHPNMLSLDTIHNPFTGNSFVGILLDHKSNDDFFIELSTQDPFYPFINHIYALKANSIKHYTTPDSFYSYFYNEGDRKIYRIRRGILNSVKSFINSVDLTISSYNQMINYYQSSTSYFAFLIGNKIILYDYIDKPSELLCTFRIFGTFNLILERYTDACEVNMGIENSVCRKALYYLIKIQGWEMSASMRNTLIISFVVFVVILNVTVFFCGKYNGWFKENNLKLLKIDKNERGKLYEIKDGVQDTDKGKDYVLTQEKCNGALPSTASNLISPCSHRETKVVCSPKTLNGNEDNQLVRSQFQKNEIMIIRSNQFT